MGHGHFHRRIPREVFERVVLSVLSRWPGTLVEGLRPSSAELEEAAGVAAERYPTAAGHLIFYRDAAMARHMEEAAYAPMADGEGPFAVIARERRNVVFAVAGLDERCAAEHTPGGPPPPAPYRAWLCSALLIEVTAVTPGDPASHPFSSWVLAEVKRACCPDAEPGAAPDRRGT